MASRGPCCASMSTSPSTDLSMERGTPCGPSEREAVSPYPCFHEKTTTIALGKKLASGGVFPEAAKEDDNFRGEHGRDPYPFRKGVAVITPRPATLCVPQL